MSPHRGGGVGVKEAEDARLDMIAARCCILIYISYMYLFDTYMCPPGALSRHMCIYVYAHVCLSAR